MASLMLTGASRASAQRCAPNVGLDFHAKEIKKSTQEVNAYDPVRGGNMVHESNDNYILFALSKKERDEWLARWKTFQRGGVCDNVDPALDELAAAVAAKIGNSSPRAEDFKFHDPAAEKGLMTLFEGSKAIKGHKIGLDTVPC